MVATKSTLCSECEGMTIVCSRLLLSSSIGLLPRSRTKEEQMGGRVQILLGKFDHSPKQNHRQVRWFREHVLNYKGHVVEITPYLNRNCSLCNGK
jgi:hypothetical protein